MNKTMTLLAIAGIASGATANIELTTNGDFEAGDLSGWQYFPAPSSTFNLTSDANSGSFAAELFNSPPPSGAVIKQANIGIGQVTAGQEVMISFAAKGSFAAGGVAFAEFFSELAGGGTSSAEILTGGPLALTDQWQTFNFTVNAGPDVSGGVTLQFVAATGADAGSTAVLFLDDVSVSIVPAPASIAMLGMGGLLAARRRR